MALLLLALLSWWLERLSAKADLAATRALPAGFQAQKIEAAQYHPDGAVRYRLTAPLARQYRENQPLELQHMVLEHFEPGQPSAFFRSPLALWRESQDKLDFPQSLEIDRAGSATTRPVNILASQVTVDNRRQTLTGVGGVRATVGEMQLTADRIDYDWKQRRLQLSSRVHMVYAKPH